MSQHDDKSKLIPPHGGYRELKSYQNAEIVYDDTVRFCDRHIDRRSRTHDQMVQAARSGKQNIAEGSMASGTSKKSELKLVGVARASLEELRWIFKISCDSENWRPGKKTTPRRERGGGWLTPTIGPI